MPRDDARGDEGSVETLGCRDGVGRVRVAGEGDHLLRRELAPRGLVDSSALVSGWYADPDPGSRRQRVGHLHLDGDGPCARDAAADPTGSAASDRQQQRRPRYEALEHGRTRGPGDVMVGR